MSDRESEWILTTFFAPGKGDRFTQSFLFYRPRQAPRLQVGAAYIWSREAVRLMGNYRLVPETETVPSVTVGFAFQGTWETQVSPFATVGKSFQLGGDTRAEIYTGLVKRPNEEHLHGINGAKLAVGPVYAGFQHTGHDTNLYIGYVFEFGSVSLWGADGRPMGILLSLFR